MATGLAVSTFNYITIGNELEVENCTEQALNENVAISARGDTEEQMLIVARQGEKEGDGGAGGDGKEHDGDEDIVPDYVKCPAERLRWFETQECYSWLGLDFSTVIGEGSFIRDFASSPLHNPYTGDGYYLHQRLHTASVLPRFINLALANTLCLPPKKDDTKDELMDLMLVGPKELEGAVLPCLVLRDAYCIMVKTSARSELKEPVPGATLLAPAIQYVDKRNHIDWFQAGDVIRKTNDKEEYFATEHWMVAAIVAHSGSSLFKEKYNEVSGGPLYILAVRLHSAIATWENKKAGMPLQIGDFEWGLCSYWENGLYTWVDNWENYYNYDHKKLTVIAHAIYTTVLCNIRPHFNTHR